MRWRTASPWGLPETTSRGAEHSLRTFGDAKRHGSKRRSAMTWTPVACPAERLPYYVMSLVDDEDDVPDEAEALDNDQIGTIGQDAFNYLCSQALITATIPKKDKYGWDYQLEWDRLREAFEPPETCFVQVKTASKGARSASITLSNWRRMAHGHAPWFVVAVALQDREAESFYVVPIDEALVARAVKKLHDRNGSVPENQATMAIRWGDPHRLEQPFHTSFLAALKAHMGPSDTDYRLQKRGWIPMNALAHRRMVNARIGMVNARIGIVNTAVGADAVP